MDVMQIKAETKALEHEWATDPRWAGMSRTYSAADVVRLRGSVRIDYTLARLGAERLRDLLSTGSLVRTADVVTGGEAVELVRSGLQAIYLRAPRAPADPTITEAPGSNSIAALVRSLNDALLRADQVEWAAGTRDREWLVPIVADLDVGSGGTLHAFEVMKAMIEAGAAAVHFGDRSPGETTLSHSRAKVLVPTAQFERTLAAARLAADVLDVPSVIIARTDSLDASLVSSDVDDRDRPFLAGERTVEGYHRVKAGMQFAIARGRSFAPLADIVWCETPTPDLREARLFAEGIHEEFPSKLLAYNCSPSFNWQRNLDATTIAKFQRDLPAMGYAFQFTTLTGWAHQGEVGREYLERVLTTIARDAASDERLERSTDVEQFRPMIAPIVGDAPPVEDAAFPLPRAPRWTNADSRRHD